LSELQVRLTDRQRAVLDLVADGLENKEIAVHLKLTEAAVKKHVSVLMRRLSARNRAALVRQAFERRILHLGATAE
jgi:DNA-binding NarL/FixJ family response regulator